MNAVARPAGDQGPLRAITRELAGYALNTRYAALPDKVQAEAARTFVNWMGCVLGGCRDPAVEIAVAVTADAGGAPQASMIGHRRRADVASAAFVNCLSSTVLSFDDTHLATVTHPTGPVAAALFAFSEKQTVSGEEFLTALALGIEIECRLSNLLLLPPAQANIGLYITGITGPVGAAAALGRLLQFDEEKMCSAIGIAAAQASGIRGTHGSMAAFFIPAHAARSGVSAAMLASHGLTCTANVLEGPKGFAEVFGRGGDLSRTVADLGRHHEMLANAYKPYPSGIVIHPTIDACLDIAQRLPVDAVIASVTVNVHPLTLELTNRRDPRTPVEAQTSLFHWVTASLVRKSAGIAQLEQGCIEDPELVALRKRIVAVANPALQRDEALAEVTLTDGTVLHSHVEHARGSMARPMTDDELDAKFLAQANMALSPEASDVLLRLCRNVAGLRSVGQEISSRTSGPA